MFTMIIADDEAIARKSLELFIRKEFPDIEVIAAAADGVELVKLVEKQQPDIAIVDINMPGLTGIEAIELLHSKSVKTRFIIHTAYGEFEYVKKALDMKVDGYLLKPERREESIQTIRRLCGDIAAKASENQEKFKMQTLLHEVSPMLENEVLLSILTNRPETEKFQTLCRVKGMEFHLGCIVTLFDNVQLKVSRKELCEIVRESLKTVCDYLISVTKTSVLLLLFLPPKIREEEKEAWLLDITKLIIFDLKEKTGADFSAGIGGVYDSFEKMGLSHEDSLRQLKNIKEKVAAGSLTGENEEKARIYVERAVSYIDRHFSQDISLEMVAGHSKLSPFYLSRLMKKEMGVTFVEYLTKVRMEEAKRLSLETALPIRDIAQRCGYSNDTYFCKVFKRYTNKTIGEYRREL